MARMQDRRGRLRDAQASLIGQLHYYSRLLRRSHLQFTHVIQDARYTAQRPWHSGNGWIAEI